MAVHGGRMSVGVALMAAVARQLRVGAGGVGVGGALESDRLRAGERPSARGSSRWEAWVATGPATVGAPGSSGAGSAANSCGIHIHSGMTCTGNALGHYYTGSVTTDPWTTIAYTSTSDGTTSGSS